MALLRAVETDNLTIVKLLVSKGIDISLAGEISLTTAAGEGYLVSIGVTSGAAMDAAATAGHQDVVNFLTDGTLPSSTGTEMDTLMVEIEDAVEKITSVC